MNTTYLTQNFQTIHKLKPLREDSEELPSFDEAFDPDHLREFFRTTESTVYSPTNSTRKLTNPEDFNTMNFIIGYSPYKEHFYDDTPYSVADTNDTYVSPQKDAAFSDKIHLLQFTKDSNVKQNLDLNRLDSYTQGIYAALDGVNYGNSIRSDLIQPGDLETISKRDNFANTENRKTKKKVFLIIRNAPTINREVSTKKTSDKSSVTNTEKGSRRGKGQRRSAKDRFKSADNINLNNYFNNYVNNDESSIKRRSSYNTSEDLVNKKLKIQKELKSDINGAFEFDLDADKDFKPGYFDILPTISFDEIINREYPEFTGNAYDNNHKC